MKWIFLIILALATPALAALLKSDRKWIPAAAFALAVLPFLESGFNLSLAPYTWKMWPGYTKGFDLSLVDAVALSIIFATKRVSTPWVIKAAFLAYLASYSISTIVAQSPTPALFYGWQLVRGLLVYYAVARAVAESPKVPVAILTGLIVGLVSQAGIALTQYGGGTARAGGWFGHPNLLGMVSHFVVFPAFAVFLGGHYSGRTVAALLAGLVIAFAGGSRATIGLIAVGLILTAGISMWHRSSGRKAAVAGLGVLLLLGSAPLLNSAVERRSTEARAKSNEERTQMKEAARMMMADHPLGVGANNYVMVANLGGYSARAGVPFTTANRAAPVHNAYYLIAAEMSILGVVSFLAMLLSIAYTAATSMRRARDGFEADYLLGMMVTIALVGIHSYVEWIVMLFPVHMLIALTAGMIVGIRARQRLPVRRQKRRSVERVETALVVQ